MQSKIEYGFLPEPPLTSMKSNHAFSQSFNCILDSDAAFLDVAAVDLDEEWEATWNDALDSFCDELDDLESSFCVAAEFIVMLVPKWRRGFAE